MRIRVAIAVVGIVAVGAGLWSYFHKIASHDTIPRDFDAMVSMENSHESDLREETGERGDSSSDATESLTVDRLTAREQQVADTEWKTHVFPGPDTFEHIEEDIQTAEDCAIYRELLEKIAALKPPTAIANADPGLLATAADLYLVERKQEVLTLQISLLESYETSPLNERQDADSMTLAIDTHRRRLDELTAQVRSLRQEAATFPGQPLQKPHDAYRLLMQTLWGELAQKAHNFLAECEQFPERGLGIRELVEQAMGLADDEAHGHSVGSLTYARQHARVSL